MRPLRYTLRAGRRSLSFPFGKDDMKRLVNLVILVSLAGVFFSGFVFWMASFSHQEAERLRQHGEYCDVVVVGKEKSSGGKSTFYYVHVRPVNREATAPPLRCSVVYPAYENLHVGQRLQAWVLGTNALLDDGPKNAASVARTMLRICAGFALLLITGLVLKVVCRTRRSTEPPPSMAAGNTAVREGGDR
jgi:hypothetical protein